MFLASFQGRLKLMIATVFLCICISTSLFSQSIHGIVYEAGTGHVIAGASVYYNSSLTGTVTSNSGTFDLPSKSKNLPIVVSCIGYDSKIVTNYSDATLVEVFLLPSIHKLEEVIVVADGMSRAEKEKQFIKEFLGTSEFAQSCTIDNMEDVGLAYSAKNKTLVAHCNKPLLIINKKLGYQIQYYLDHFIKTSRNIVYAGNYSFKDIMNPENEEEILRNRQKAYQGSRMQFIRALYNGQLKENGFSIYTPLYDKLSEKDVVRSNDSSEKFIQLNQRLLITYQTRANKFSSLIQTHSGAYITSDGFYDANLRWDGPMAVQRIGDLLPYEYMPPKGGNSLLADIGQKPDSESFINKSVDSVAGIKEKASKLSLSAIEREAVNAVVLSPNNVLDKKLIIKKWQVPVRYKLYGSFGQTNDQKLVDYMSRLSDLTGLQILPAATDSDANFYILCGGNPDRFAHIIKPEVLTYLKLPENSGYYYTVSDNGFIQMFLLIGFYQHPSEAEKWEAIKKKLVKGFGLFGTLPDQENSVFYPYANSTSDNIEAFDAMIIQSLYGPAVKSGMTKQQLNAVLKPAN